MAENQDNATGVDLTYDQLLYTAERWKTEAGKQSQRTADLEHEVRVLRGHIDAWRRIARQRAEELTAGRKALDNARSVLARTLLVVGKQAVTIDMLEDGDSA